MRIFNKKGQSAGAVLLLHSLRDRENNQTPLNPVVYFIWMSILFLLAIVTMGLILQEIPK